MKRGGQRILAEAEDASSFGFANDDGEGDDGDDLYPDLSLWGENEEEDAGRGVEASGAAAEDEGEDGEGDFGEDWRAEGNETAARKKGRTWHKYMKTSRELKRLQNLLPDLEGGSLFDEGEVSWGDGVAFLEYLSVSPMVHRCYAEHLLTYAEGRAMTSADEDRVDRYMQDSLDGQPIIEMLYTMVTEPAFRRRP